jgi:hypothetical protein
VIVPIPHGQYAKLGARRLFAAPLQIAARLKPPGDYARSDEKRLNRREQSCAGGA